jgi:hypothetical protein
MKLRKNFTLILLLGLLLTVFAATSAQTPSQGDQKKASESCCSTESCCCCSGDSCDMKMKHDTKMNHDMKGHKGDCCKMKQKAKDKKAA